MCIGEEKALKTTAFETTALNGDGAISKLEEKALKGE